jgi:hypothetical protein
MSRSHRRVCWWPHCTRRPDTQAGVCVVHDEDELVSLLAPRLRDSRPPEADSPDVDELLMMIDKGLSLDAMTAVIVHGLDASTIGALLRSGQSVSWVEAWISSQV